MQADTAVAFADTYDSLSPTVGFVCSGISTP